MRKASLLVLIVWNFATALAFKLLFDYSNPNHWSKDHPQCAGYLQSPVVLAASRSVPLPLPALEMIGYHDFLRPPLIFKNNGHTVSLKIKHDVDDPSKKNPYIFGAVLKEGDTYELESFHFHWGARNNRGSEHVLHGTRYPMEMHLIHRNMKYKNLESSIFHEDGLAVLAIFFHEEDNDELKVLIAHLAEIQTPNSETQLNSTFKLASLLPEHLDTYYTYKGSLTTPPCNEAVTWIVFASSVPISFKQMNKFRILSNGKGMLADNYRLLQELGYRKVYVRRTYSNSMNVNEISDLDVSSLKWHWQ